MSSFADAQSLLSGDMRDDMPVGLRTNRGNAFFCSMGVFCRPAGRSTSLEASFGMAKTQSKVSNPRMNSRPWRTFDV
jgi:hypothetical protein